MIHIGKNTKVKLFQNISAGKSDMTYRVLLIYLKKNNSSNYTSDSL